MSLRDDIRSSIRSERFTAPLQTKITPSQKQDFEELATELGITVSELLRYFALKGLEQVRSK